MSVDQERDFASTVLVSGEGLLATLYGMQENCRFLDLLDFCTLAEAVVLNDRIEIVCDVEYAYALGQSHIVSVLQDAGIVLRITTHRGNSYPAGGARETRAGLRLDAIGSNRFTLKSGSDGPGEERIKRDPLGTFTLDQILDETTSLLRAERALGISALAMRRFAALYGPNAKLREEHTVCDLMSRYDELSAGLRQLRALGPVPLSPLVVAQIPPIPVTVLQRAASGRDVLTRILEVREDFRALRHSLTRLRRDLDDQDIPPKDKLRIFASWQRSWKTLEKYGTGGEIAMGNTSYQVIDVDKTVDAGVLDLKLSALLDMILDAARSGFHRWRVRILHRTAERYLGIADGQIVRDLERLYKKTFDRRDLKELRDWEAMIAQMPIDLEGMTPKQDYIIERSPAVGQEE